ncbi:hypothetical protein BT69DRAFT_401997 [Atractiella rhizophila]|nr:hypothetical protein BT69DRAFT_401997 [Atractiella rhizophila]
MEQLERELEELEREKNRRDDEEYRREGEMEVEETRIEAGEEVDGMQLLLQAAQEGNEGMETNLQDLDMLHVPNLDEFIDSLPSSFDDPATGMSPADIQKIIDSLGNQASSEVRPTDDTVTATARYDVMDTSRFNQEVEDYINSLDTTGMAEFSVEVEDFSLVHTSGGMTYGQFADIDASAGIGADTDAREGFRPNVESGGEEGDVEMGKVEKRISGPLQLLEEEAFVTPSHLAPEEEPTTPVKVSHSHLELEVDEPTTPSPVKRSTDLRRISLSPSFEHRPPVQEEQDETVIVQDVMEEVGDEAEGGDKERASTIADGSNVDLTPDLLPEQLRTPTLSTPEATERSQDVPLVQEGKEDQAPNQYSASEEGIAGANGNLKQPTPAIEQSIQQDVESGLHEPLTTPSTADSTTQPDETIVSVITEEIPQPVVELISSQSAVVEYEEGANGEVEAGEVPAARAVRTGLPGAGEEELSSKLTTHDTAQPFAEVALPSGLDADQGLRTPLLTTEDVPRPIVEVPASSGLPIAAEAEAAENSSRHTTDELPLPVVEISTSTGSGLAMDVDFEPAITGDLPHPVVVVAAGAEPALAPSNLPATKSPRSTVIKDPTPSCVELPEVQLVVEAPSTPEAVEEVPKEDLSSVQPLPGSTNTSVIVERSLESITSVTTNALSPTAKTSRRSRKSVFHDTHNELLPVSPSRMTRSQAKKDASNPSTPQPSLLVDVAPGSPSTSSTSTVAAAVTKIPSRGKKGQIADLVDDETGEAQISLKRKTASTSRASRGRKSRAVPHHGRKSVKAKTEEDQSNNVPSPTPSASRADVPPSKASSSNSSVSQPRQGEQEESAIEASSPGSNKGPQVKRKGRPKRQDLTYRPEAGEESSTDEAEEARAAKTKKLKKVDELPVEDKIVNARGKRRRKAKGDDTWKPTQAEEDSDSVNDEDTRPRKRPKFKRGNTSTAAKLLSKENTTDGEALASELARPLPERPSFPTLVKSVSSFIRPRLHHHGASAPAAPVTTPLIEVVHTPSEAPVLSRQATSNGLLAEDGASRQNQEDEHIKQAVVQPPSSEQIPLLLRQNRDSLKN